MKTIALALTLLTWIGENTDYDVTPILEREARVPAIVFDHPVFVESLGHGPAAYEAAVNRIWLAEGKVDLATTQGKGILVHELVHHLQDEHPTRIFPCHRAKEIEAYSVHEAYLEAHGAELDIDWATVLAYGMCHPGYP
jgi:hypothetical protein